MTAIKVAGVMCICKLCLKTQWLAYEGKQQGDENKVQDWQGLVNFCVVLLWLMVCEANTSHSVLPNDI